MANTPLGHCTCAPAGSVHPSEGVNGNPTPPAAQPLRTRRPRTVSQRDDGSCHRGTGLPCRVTEGRRLVSQRDTADYNGRVMEATAISESKALANESLFTHVGNNHPGGNGRRANDLGRNGGWSAALVGDMEDKGTERYGNGSSKWAGGSSAAHLDQF